MTRRKGSKDSMGEAYAIGEEAFQPSEQGDEGRLSAQEPELPMTLPALYPGVVRSQRASVTRGSSVDMSSNQAFETTSTTGFAIRGDMRAVSRTASKATSASVPDSKKAESTRKKIYKTHKFFRDLSDHEREMFAVVTQDISLQNTAGLQSIKRRLWEGRELFRLLTLVLQSGQVVLNCFTAVRTCTSVLYNLADPTADLSLSAGGLRICNHRISTEHSDVTSGCIETGLARKRLTQVFIISEAAVVSVMTGYVFWSSLYLLCCRNPRSYAGRRYFVMMALPKITARFSFLMFLHMANAERLKSFLLRGEFRCLASLCLDSFRKHVHGLMIVPGYTQKVVPFVTAEHFARAQERFVSLTNNLNFVDLESLNGEFPETERRHRRCRAETVCRALGLVMCILLIFMALHALLIKLMLIYFAGLTSYTDWDLREWLMFLGFVNQLSGLSMSSEVETLRVLLFRFGGEHTKWSAKQIEACGTYFRYLAARLVEQLGTWKALVLMWTMSSADLQSLFQGHQRLQEQNAVIGDTIEMFHCLDDSAKLEQMRDQLIRNFQQRHDSLEQSLKMVPQERRLELLNFVESRAIGELRLAAQVQEHIWQWKKVALHDEDGQEGLKSESCEPALHDECDHQESTRESCEAASEINGERKEGASSPNTLG